MRKVIYILSVVLTFVLLESCELRPLDELNKNLLLLLKIDFNIKNVTTLPEPEIMRVIFYDPKTDKRYTEDYVPAEGGPISIPPGNYDVMVYNFDTESTMIRNDISRLRIEAYTNEVSSQVRNNAINSIKRSIVQSKASTDEDSEPVDSAWLKAMEQLENVKIVYEPDHLFVARDNITIYERSGEQVIETRAETVVETYFLSVRVTNIKYMATANALLTGQIGSNFIGFPKEEGKSDDDVTLFFQMEAGTDSLENDVVQTTFNTFGKLPGKESRLWLTIIMTSLTGEPVVWHRDITDEFNDNPDLKIVIEDDPIVVPIPEPGTGGGGGFQPGVAEWEEEHHYIDL